MYAFVIAYNDVIPSSLSIHHIMFRDNKKAPSKQSKIDIEGAKN